MHEVIAADAPNDIAIGRSALALPVWRSVVGCLTR